VGQSFAFVLLATIEKEGAHDTNAARVAQERA
jgi:hypothetical protein